MMKNQEARRSETVRIERLLIACALVGLAFSALLYAEYQSPGAGLCSLAGGGCDEVRASAYSSIAGIQLPALGIAYFLTLLTVTLVPALRGALAPLAVVGGLAGATFIALQAFVIGAWCPLCLVVDLAAIGGGVLGVAARNRSPVPLTAARGVSVGALALLALGLATIGAPATDGGEGPVSTTATVPGVIARLQKEAPVTVVEFIDFQCPACTYQHGVFQQVKERVDYDVHMVYLHAPLPQHEYAADAARAYICAEDQGRGPAMADALFATENPVPSRVREIADGLGLDGEEFSRCLLSRQTEERLRLDGQRAQEVRLESLPTFWIGNRKFVGAARADAIVDALDRLAYR